MEPARREFKVGKLVIKGHQFEFHPEPSLAFTARPGDIGDVYLHYGYREASRDKETLDLSFAVELDGEPIGTRRTKVEDSRVVTDEQWGLLKHETTLAKKGVLKGRYTIDAKYDVAAWSGKGDTKSIPFHKSGEFTVTIR